VNTTKLSTNTPVVLHGSLHTKFSGEMLNIQENLTLTTYKMSEKTGEPNLKEHKF
jgi:hypothetical protein